MRHVALAIALGCCSGAALASSLVVSSQGPSAARYRVGTRLATGQELRLGAGDRLSIIDRGAVRSLRGPGRYTVGRSGPAAQPALLKVLLAEGGRRARPGAVRGPAGPRDLPAAAERSNIWIVDAERDAVACYAPDRSIRLWRRRQGTSETYSLTGADGAAAGSVALKRGEHIAAIRTARPLAATGGYSLAGPGGRTIRLRPVVLPPAPSDEEAVAALGAEFARNGCSGQLDALVRLLDSGGAAEARP